MARRPLAALTILFSLVRPAVAQRDFRDVLNTLPVDTSPAAGWLDATSPGAVDTAAHLRALLADQLDTDAYSYDFSRSPSGAPSPVPTTAEICPDGLFRYELALFAYDGGGWAGGAYRLEQLLDDQKRELISEGTLDAGSYGVETFCLENGNYLVDFGGGAAPGEMGIQWLPEDIQKVTTCFGPCQDYATMIDGRVLDYVTTPAPTAADARAVTLLTFSVEVTGVPDDIFRDTTTKKIVQYATRDVVPDVEAPDQVVGAAVSLLAQRRRLQEDRPRHSVELTIQMGGESYKTCGECGYASPRACLDALVATMNASIASGEYRERLLYWAKRFNTPWPEDTTVGPVRPEPSPDWAFAQTSAPTAGSSSKRKRKSRGLSDAGVAAIVVSVLALLAGGCLLFWRRTRPRKDSEDSKAWSLCCSSPSPGGPYSPDSERRGAVDANSSGGAVSPGGTVSPAQYSPASIDRDLAAELETRSAPSLSVISWESTTSGVLVDCADLDREDCLLVTGGSPARPDTIPRYAPTPTPRRRRRPATPTPVALQKLSAPLEL